MNMIKILAYATAVSLAMAGTPSFAGEVTGTGEQVDARGRSICKFSGQNDGNPPPGRVQSYGKTVSGGFNDPTEFDPDGGFQSHPGWFCNPNNFDALENLPL